MSNKIKSMDDLRAGDVVLFNKDYPYLVHAIGEVPEHEREVLLLRLYEPGLKGNITGTNVKREINLNETELFSIDFEKVERSGYIGWKYFEYGNEKPKHL